jgi:3-hydroxybenzoate 6-monooxygenase
VGTRDQPIIIVGGGLAGLVTALALGRAGWRVRILEQAEEFGAIGYGIQLGPNVVPMFDRLGVTAAVLEAGDVPQACRMMDAYTGAEITRVATGPSLIARFKHPYILIHRVDLHHVLMDACHAIPAITFEPAAAATGFEDRGDRVIVHVEGGRSLEGAALIAADGLRSTIRAQLRHEGEPMPVGYVAQRTIVPMEQVPEPVPRENVYLWAGPGFHMVHYPLRHGTLFNIVAVYRTETYAQKIALADCHAEVARTYVGTHPAMQAMLAMMNLERRWPISDREPIRHWAKGRVIMVGDAAHPALQSFAQGACMAIEDGVCLAALIDLAGGDFTSAFAQFEAERYVRTARLQLESRYMWGVYHAEDIARDVVRATFADRTEDDVFRCLAWLYDGVSVPTRLASGSRVKDAV